MVDDIEIWSDSFKEGEWFVEDVLGAFFNITNTEYRWNFQPHYRLETVDGYLIRADVYGDYRCWSDVPPAVEELLDIGKPDVVVVDPRTGSVILAVEETAAVPTGNQALQRLERVWSAARLGIPFVYLLGEYGVHLDGGVRRNSIWPTYLAMKLSSQYQIPSMTLMYGSAADPFSYETGRGLAHLRAYTSFAMRRHFGWGIDVADERALLIDIFGEMGRFVSEHASEITSHLPGGSILGSPEVATELAERARRKIGGQS